jgi:phosphoglycolate phosphatase
MTTRHVIWDWNGTLLDDVWLCVDVLNGMLRARGLPEVGEAYYRDVFSFPVINVYRRMGFDVSNGAFERMSVEYIEAYQSRRDECGLHIGARAALDAFKTAGVGQSILSAYRQDMLDSIIANMGIGAYFERLAGNANIYAASKVEYGRALVAGLACAKEEVVMVGDTEHDWEVARELGIRCVLVSCGHNTHARLARLGVPVVATVGEVPALLGAGLVRQTAC